MADRALIVNADDFGLSAGVNAGVARTHEEGILTSASLMVRQPGAEQAAAYARATPALGVGLHVDLGEWVRRDGAWTAVYEVVPIDGDPQAVEAEVRGQLARFRALTGHEPTHLDSHQHVHNWESVTDVFQRLAKQLGVPLRHHLGGVAYCGDLYGHDEHGRPIPQAITPAALMQIIGSLAPGVTELACHPGIGADTGSPYGREREQEVEVLCDPGIAEALRREGIALRSFADVASGWNRRPLRFPLMQHEGFTLWLTGLPRSGKSTVAGLVAGRLRAMGVERIEVLDGDIIREGLCRGLGFSREDRTENIRRIAFVSKLLTRNGTAVIVAAISPYREDRELAREEIQSFVEVWAHASVDACADRDYKGLYEKARRGEIDSFTGVNDPYEAPEDADLVLDTENDSPEVSADQVMTLLRERGLISR